MTTSPNILVQPGILLAKAEVMRLTGWTARTVEIKDAAKELVSRETSERARNGRPVKKYALSSLPEAAQQKFRSESTAIVPVSPAQQALSLYKAQDGSTVPDSAPQRVALLSPEAQKQANDRWEILKPVVVDYRITPDLFSVLKLADGGYVTSKSRLVQWLSEFHGISVRTLKEWERRYRKEGLSGLADKPRADKGKSRWMEQHPEAKIIVADAYLSAHRSKRAAHEALIRNAEKIGLTPDEICDYETIRAWLESDDVPEALKILARQGERALNEECLPYLTRDYTSIGANEIWQSDHMIHDMIVSNDVFEDVMEGALMRLRLTAIMDMRTRMYVGYSWAPEGSSRSIASALQMAILRYGVCRIFYCDNGKDFIKATRGAKHPYMRSEVVPQILEDYDWLAKIGVLARLNVLVQHCLKYHPQAKNIERSFRTLHEHLDGIFAHYLTGNAYNRPDAANAAMAEHGKLLRMGRASESPVIPASEFILMATTWIEEDYNAKHRHHGQGMDGRTPREVFDELYPLINRKPPQLADIAQLFWQVSKPVNIDSSQIKVNKHEYIAADEQSAAQMYLANGQKVVLHYDPLAPERGVITNLDGYHIASVKEKVPTPHAESSQSIIAESMRQRHSLRNATAGALRAVHKGAKLLGATSAYDDLRERAALPAAVGELVTQRIAAQKTPSVPERMQSEDIAEEFLRNCEEN